MLRECVFGVRMAAAVGLVIVLGLFAISGCSKKEKQSATAEIESTAVEGEESSPRVSLEDTLQVVRGGARLTLAFDEATRTFRGTVVNTTSEVLRRVRVEVHLSGGVGLGPTPPRDLQPGASLPVALPLTDPSISFETWTAHAEVGSEESGEHAGEAGERGEHSSEHTGEGRSEHREGATEGILHNPGFKPEKSSSTSNGLDINRKATFIFSYALMRINANASKTALCSQAQRRNFQGYGRINFLVQILLVHRWQKNGLFHALFEAAKFRKSKKGALYCLAATLDKVRGDFDFGYRLSAYPSLRGPTVHQLADGRDDAIS
ncbi:hypothetical protein D6833_05760 [Candidatus Parcubacteria bacterium]|nr:MAG: hypothetical protein D6833_05760 [Candidatus Parcubacteria bacterium]